jgi:hypothetical protein
VHKFYVEALVAEEEAALLGVAGTGGVLRVERRGSLLVAEIERVIYQREPGTAIPLLGQRRTSSIVAALDCDNYDTDAPSFAFVTNWDATEVLAFQSWPKGPGMVDRHYKTGKPFLCRPGTREFHSHIQHLDEPWDRYRGRLRIRDLVLGLARDLQHKDVF